MSVKRVTHREFRNNSGQVLGRVANGESFVITNHGRPVARLVPISEDDPLAELLASGLATPPTRDRRLPLPGRRATTLTSADVMADIRGER